MLVLTAALVAPFFIDWASYRAAFEREASRVLGREVRVEGTARARLLPFPSVTFTDVTVAGAGPGDPGMTVDEFSMDAELAPFLRGEVLIFDMRLVGPDMTIEIGEDGGIDWAVRPSSPFDPRQVTLERMTISGGTITVHQQASGRTITLADVETEVSARTLAGPWRVSGTMTVDEMPVALTAATGTASEGAMRVRLSVLPQDYPLMIEADGEARFEGDEGRYAGTFRLFTTVQAPDGPPQPANPGNRMSGRFALDHTQLALEEFRFETGPADDPYVAEGEAVVALGAEPSFSVTADGAQIRIAGGEAEGGMMPGLSADERLAALTAFVTNLPKPTIPGTIAVNLPAIVAGDTTIRDISIRAQPAEEGWNIGSLAATLPGRTRFEGEGLLATGETLSFDGKMLLAIRQPSGFAAWLARDVNDAIRRLPAAGFSADVSLTEERQRFENLELILGDARFRGAIDRNNPADARPSVMIALDGSQLDIEGMQAFASLFVDDAGRSRLADYDVDMEITAGPVSAQGLVAERLDTALRLRDGKLEIDRLTITGLAGASISATGTIGDMGQEPTGRLDASVVAVDLAPLVGVLAERFPEATLLAALDRSARAYPGLFADSELQIMAGAADNGDGSNGLSISATGTAGGTEFSLSVSGTGATGELANARLAVTFAGRNDDAAGLYGLLGLPALPLDIAGPAETEITADGTLADGLATRFRFAGEGLEANFEGEIAAAESGYSADGQARLRSDDLEPWLTLAGLSLPGMGYGLPVDLAARLDHGEGLTVLNDIAGNIAGLPVSGDLNGELRENLPHLSGELDLGGLDLGLVAEMIGGGRAFEAGEGTWPEAPFAERAQLPLSADLELSADRLWLGNAATLEQARLHLRLENDGISLSEVSGRFLDGTVEGMAEFRNDQGTGLFSTQLSLRDTPLSALFPDASLEGRTDLSASLSASGKSVRAMVAALSGSGSAVLRGVEVTGINPAALGPVLTEADALGVDIDAAAVEHFAPPILRDGIFPAGDAELAFTVANGVARVPPLQLEAGGARMSVDAAADFRERRVSASGTVSYDPGLEAVAGSEPTLRFSIEGQVGEAQLTLDTEPLAQFLTQRALEREQARVEHMQALLLERQRLRREATYFRAVEAEREAAEAERVRLEREAERLRQEEEAQRQAAEEAQRQADETARREAEEARRQAEEERRRAEEEERRRAEEETWLEGEEAPEADILAPQREGVPGGATMNDEFIRTDISTEPFLHADELTIERLLETIEPQQH